MTTAIYLGGGKPVASISDDKLSDGSIVWNLSLNGKDIPCLDETRAKASIRLIYAALKAATASDPIML